MTRVQINTRRIVDWPSFHTVFAEALGFPASYGRNMNAWIDCMTYVDDSDAGMSAVTVPRGEILTLEGESAVLALSYHRGSGHEPG